MKKQRKKILIFIILIILILLFIRNCSSVKKIINETAIIDKIIEQNKEEKELLKLMKEDEQYLKELYMSANICEKEWIVDYRNVGKRFKEYKYNGKDEEIKELLKEYYEYGIKIEEISITIDKSNYEKGVEELEVLKD
ncbi:MAG: hypothetical protein MR601_01410, partial [Erysipelotrichaceae bacterium]|nr:hypothetical protein [Erysipelotrichaceae bacterium]